MNNPFKERHVMIRPTRLAAGAIVALAAVIPAGTTAAAATHPTAERHGWCSFTAGSATVTVTTTRFSVDTVHVDIDATRAINLQPGSYFIYPKYFMAPGHGIHLSRAMGDESRPVAVHVRATRGGHNGSCDAPVTSH